MKFSHCTPIALATAACITTTLTVAPATANVVLPPLPGPPAAEAPAPAEPEKRFTALDAQVRDLTRVIALVTTIGGIAAALFAFISQWKDRPEWTSSYMGALLDDPANHFYNQAYNTLTLINARRVEAGLAPLDWNADMATAAAAWNETLIQEGAFGVPADLPDSFNQISVDISSVWAQTAIDEMDTTRASRTVFLDPAAQSAGVAFTTYKTKKGREGVFATLITTTAPVAEADRIDRVYPDSAAGQAALQQAADATEQMNGSSGV
ncbi:MAG: CAP domain-containing protein [Corynebacterium sp.]|nr:CAP domain-containing protein [Corynebacterium sp.]